MTSKQAKDALLIQDPGACNPRGVARALVESIDADALDTHFTPSYMRDGLECDRTSPATRLIAHQLIWILTGKDIAIVPMYNADDYSADVKACRAESGCSCGQADKGAPGHDAAESEGSK